MTQRRIPMLVLAFAVGLAVSLLPAAAFAAEDGMEWQFSELNDPENKGRMTARLIYGVPETDNVQVSGVCDAAPSTSVKFSSMTFAADMGADLADGANVDLRFTGGGFDHAMTGSIYRPRSEEDIAGVHLDIEHDDPLWQALLEKDSLDYLVPGYRASTLSLSGGREKIRSFIEACRTYAKVILGEEAGAGPQAGTAKAAAASPAQDVSCEELGSIRSKNSDTPAQITFVNHSGALRSILWLDFEGQPKTYASLNADQQVTLDTYQTHPWMVTDGPGNCLMMVLPVSSESVVEILKPAAGARPAWQLEAIEKGCEPGLAWNPQEGCHEND